MTAKPEGLYVVTLNGLYHHRIRGVTPFLRNARLYDRKTAERLAADQNGPGEALLADTAPEFARQGSPADIAADLIRQRAALRDVLRHVVRTLEAIR